MTESYDLICFSSGGWDARRHALLVRAARDRQVVFLEPPLREDGPAGRVVRTSAEDVTVVQPILPRGLSPSAEHAHLRELVDDLIVDFEISRHALWFATASAVPSAHHLTPDAVIYDCEGTAPAERDPLLTASADLVLLPEDGPLPWSEIADWIEAVVTARTIEIVEDTGTYDRWDYGDLDGAVQLSA